MISKGRNVRIPHMHTDGVSGTIRAVCEDAQSICSCSKPVHLQQTKLHVKGRKTPNPPKENSFRKKKKVCCDAADLSVLPLTHLCLYQLSAAVPHPPSLYMHRVQQQLIWIRLHLTCVAEDVVTLSHTLGHMVAFQQISPRKRPHTGGFWLKGVKCKTGKWCFVGPFIFLASPTFLCWVWDFTLDQLKEISYLK